MSLKRVTFGIALAASIWPPPAGAQSPWPNLGPEGNGRRFFLQYNCYGCHGNEAEGQIGPSIQGATIDDVYNAVMRGEPYGGMPSFQKYASRADVNNIWSYLQSIGTQKEPKWVEWWVPYPKY